jgi:hypothetical protein
MNIGNISGSHRDSVLMSALFLDDKTAEAACFVDISYETVMNSKTSEDNINIHDIITKK